LGKGRRFCEGGVPKRSVSKKEKNFGEFGTPPCQRGAYFPKRKKVNKGSPDQRKGGELSVT